MIQFNPHLSIKYLKVTSRNNVVFEAPFHTGLNIIRGENSSGKSTILDFLFFALGGDLTEWREASQLCDRVLIEVSVNGRTATLSREVSIQKFRPMEVYLGSLSNAEKAPKGEWQIFPYARSPHKESFSQVLFTWLGIPEVAGEAEGKITMHQLLRLLYVDQMTPIDQIFRFEQRDSPLIRQTVGDLLCGAYDNDLYTAQIRYAELGKEFDDAKAELSNILKVIGSTGHALTSSWIDAEQRKVKSNLSDVQKQIEELEERIFHGEVSDGLSRDEQVGAYNEIVRIQIAIAQSRKERDELGLEISDSDRYINSLRDKLDSIHDASTTASALKNITFMYCPSCLAPLDEGSAHSCILCKSPFDEENAQSRILAMINDMAQQIKQSERLQIERNSELKRLEQEILKLDAEWEANNRRYQLANRTPSTELRTKAKNLHRKAGALEQELLNLNEKAVLIRRLEDLSGNKAGIQAELSRLDDFIKAKRREQENYISRVYTKISDNTCDLLRLDLERQNTFQKAENVVFSFGDNRLSVNGESYFSASSMVVFKNCFMVALLKTAMETASFRHPRILIMDTIEDKGIEPSRSHNFQMLLKDISENAQTEHQIIYATSMIAPALEESDYLVGDYYTHDKRTLSFSGS